MSKSMQQVWSICRRLETADPRFVEIESKWRVVDERAKDLRHYLEDMKGVEHDKRAVFFDQYLDTPDLAVLKKGASLRLRYKGAGTQVYLQYKGPGFHSGGLLYRSEFSSQKLAHVVREESHHDLVHFNDTSVREILDKHVAPEMAHAMQRHLGLGLIARINSGPILCSYQKDKFVVDLGDAYLEPSVDRLVAFHVNKRGLHAVSTFWEYENEIKADGESLELKLEHLEELVKFDRRLAKKFGLKPERFDKYHRCASQFVARPSRARR